MPLIERPVLFYIHQPLMTGPSYYQQTAVFMCVDVFLTGLRSVRKVISRSKFTEQIFSPAAEQNFLIDRHKEFSLTYVHEKDK